MTSFSLSSKWCYEFQIRAINCYCIIPTTIVLSCNKILIRMDLENKLDIFGKLKSLGTFYIEMSHKINVYMTSSYITQVKFSGRLNSLFITILTLLSHLTKLSCEMNLSRFKMDTKAGGIVLVPMYEIVIGKIYLSNNYCTMRHTW